jgi:hypothetical protein
MMSVVILVTSNVAAYMFHPALELRGKLENVVHLRLGRPLCNPIYTFHWWRVADATRLGIGEKIVAMRREYVAVGRRANHM